VYSMGGRVGERAGAEFSEAKTDLDSPPEPTERLRRE